MKKAKMTRDTVPQDFTLALAASDALPVLFFGGSTAVLGILLQSPLFLIGAAICLWAGLAKVLWKLIVVLKQKNVWWLFLQMRIAMPFGFLLIILAAVLKPDAIGAAGAALASRPVSAVLLAAGVLGMVLMGIYAAKLDSGSVKVNRTEQLTNTLAQLCIFLGLLFLLL